MIPGKTYKISYDIRTADEGVEIHSRSYLDASGTMPLNVENHNEVSSVTYDVGNEWVHIESTYTASVPANLILVIKGGQRAEDNQTFDLNNVKFEIVD